MTGRRLERTTLIDEFIAALEAEIFSGERVEGSRLPSETELGDQFGVSRTVVREGLSRLRERGLVRTVNGRGTVVQLPGPGEVSRVMLRQLRVLQQEPERTADDLYEARLAIESTTVRLAAERASDADLAALRTSLDSMRAHIHDPAAFGAADVAFHVRIATAARNPFLAIVLQPILDVIVEGVLVSSSASAAVADGVRAHQEILERVAAGDRTGAEDAMARHLADSRRSFPDSILAHHLGA